MDIAKMKNYFENLPGVNAEAFKVAWAKHAGVLATVTNMDNIQQISRILDENAVDYIDATTGIPVFTFFAFRPQELTPERIASLQLITNKNTQTMGR